MNKLTKERKRILIEKSYNSRVNALRMMKNGSSHLGGVLSCLDILTVLFNEILRHNPKNPKWMNRDRFILSAGHKAVALYVTLQDQGYFDESILWTYNRFRTKVPEHPDSKLLPGVEFPTGALGHGLSVSCGMAIIAKMINSNCKFFTLLGEGECSEGTVWEAAMAASHYKLDNLVAIIDLNGLQVNGRTKDIMNSAPLDKKFSSFGWEVQIIDGHNYDEIYSSLKNTPIKAGKPTCVIANTVKCKGISFAENDFTTHHCHWEEEKINKAIIDLNENKKKELGLIEW